MREYYPLTLLPVVDRPVFRSSFAVANTLRTTVPPIKGVISRHGYRNPDLLWLSQSRISAGLERMVRARRTACRLSDDWAHFPNVPRALLRAERNMIDRADAVFVTSRRLLDQVTRHRRDAVYLPNGVDSIFFGRHDTEPEVLRPYPRPRIVFVGTLGEWVDPGRVRAVARRNPGASVILVGPGRIPDAPDRNVHSVGSQPFELIPGILRHCDVAIIPFVKNVLTDAVSPVKLFEYLATGIPVVATRLDEIEATASPAVLATSVEDFADAVAEFLSGKLHWSREDAVAFARQHTWETRFKKVIETLA
ncbi:MAG: glycosyltransferase [Candidatus Krumholzibacteriota bacterium]|nr:glycosyltransferase [Candidatus Krumholzibacteriota bacterium]